jgi:hypothetical protein
MLGLGTPDSDFLVSGADGDGGLDGGSEFGFEPSDPDLLFDAVGTSTSWDQCYDF